MKYIYHVHFVDPPFRNSGSEEVNFFFTSIASFFEMFSRDQLGISLNSLWRYRSRSHGEIGLVYRNSLVEVSRVALHSKSSSRSKQ